MDFKEYFKQNQVEISDRDRLAIELGGLITAARLYANLSQKQLAEKIGTKQPSIARAENGEVMPSMEFLFKIAKAIKTDFILPNFSFMKNCEEVPTQFSHFSRVGGIEETNVRAPDTSSARGENK